MKKLWHPILLWLLTLSLIFSSAVPISASPAVTSDEPTYSVGAEDGSFELACKSAYLMEAKTGTVLYSQNATEALPPASVTKIMTLLLVMEALDSGVVRLDSTVTVSANAASMGGSQVYLKEGEKMTLEDLLKSVVIASANDAAVALAEFVAGSVSAFVEKMNRRAAELGMTETTFENVTGLDDTAEAHLTSAKDIALMSRALIAHPTILQYSSIWMDTIRNGEFGLTNTNRLVRFYPGCTGLKTGSTSKAGFCVSVTAERENLSLICVVMGAESRDSRNAIATQLLDWGFASFGLYTQSGGTLDPMAVQGGVSDGCPISYGDFQCVLPKSEISRVEVRTVLSELLKAPVKAGDAVGSREFYLGNEKVGSVPIVAEVDIPKINFFEIFARLLAKFLLV